MNVITHKSHESLGLCLSLEAHQAIVNPSFSCMKHLSIFVLLLDALVTHSRVSPSIKFSKTHFLHLDEERHRES